MLRDTRWRVIWSPGVPSLLARRPRRVRRPVRTDPHADPFPFTSSTRSSMSDPYHGPVLYRPLGNRNGDCVFLVSSVVLVFGIWSGAYALTTVVEGPAMTHDKSQVHGPQRAGHAARCTAHTKPPSPARPGGPARRDGRGAGASGQGRGSRRHRPTRRRRGPFAPCASREQVMYPERNPDFWVYRAYIKSWQAIQHGPSDSQTHKYVYYT